MWHNIPEVNLALVVLLLVRTARFQTPQLSLTYDQALQRFAEVAALWFPEDYPAVGSLPMQAKTT